MILSSLGNDIDHVSVSSNVRPISENGQMDYKNHYSKLFFAPPEIFFKTTLSAFVLVLVSNYLLCLFNNLL